MFYPPSLDLENAPALDVLAIAAHPDDIEQTCGGALLKMAAMGYLTGALDLTAGDMGTRGTPELRMEEARKAAAILRLGFRENLQMPDARLENSLPLRMTLMGVIRRLKPRVLILPYWEARHPDHYAASILGFEAAFLSGIRKMDEQAEPHRPFKVVYASMYANVTPSFVVDITPHFDARMESLFAYESQYGETAQGGGLFPGKAEIHDRLRSIARFYGNLIGAKYGEPYVVKETMRVDDLVTMGVRSF
ncbi:MAG: bacillithiol biosynthesis deacetylase BshB1 [Candidatus Solibacter usitatus]|nr:bacillithiol biosynthesis deacetylase BshB1 [Candidatus Solibacter usitatus]